MPIFDQAIAAILNNVADIIEGGNSYRGSGTAWKGIAGSQSLHTLAGTAITAGGGSTTTVAHSAEVTDAQAADLVVTNSPPMFLKCTSQASGSGNTGAARKITGYAAGTDTFTVAPAFAEAVAATDTFVLLEGFRRAVDNFDILDPEVSSGDAWDRYFDLRMLPGKRMTIYGAGVRWFDTELEVRVLFRKAARQRNAWDAAFENIMRFRSILTLPSLRDGTYTQSIESENTEPSPLEEDAFRLVISDRYRLTYRVTDSYL